MPLDIERTGPSRSSVRQTVVWLLLLGSACIPISLLWDYSWECSIGIDSVWAPPHLATYLSVATCAISALALVGISTLSPVGRASSVRLGALHAPIGAWLALWGAAAFLVALLFERWWRATYGLGAGIWHPPQISKAVAYFSVLIGVWLVCLWGQNQSSRAIGSAQALGFTSAGGLVLAMVTVVTLVTNYPNRQHSVWFYELSCSTYPVLLAALAIAGKLPYPATAASLAYMTILCLMVWLLPLFPAKPQMAPIYNAMNHMMPPPFPLLLAVPAVAFDVLIRNCDWSQYRFRFWLQAGLAGVAFLILFIAGQWLFAEFLLTDQADNWFFAGGGRHWPFFLKISAGAQRDFWIMADKEMNMSNILTCAGLSIGAVALGVWIGHWMQRLRR